MPLLFHSSQLLLWHTRIFSARSRVIFALAFAARTAARFSHALLVCMSASRTISLGYNYASCLVGGFMLNVSQHTLRYYCCVSTLYNGIIYLEVNYFDIMYLLSSFRLVTKSIPIIRMQSIAGSEGIDFM